MQYVQSPGGAIDLVRRFHEMRVLVIGDALLDSYLEGEAARLSRDGPIPVVRKTIEQRLPGGAANVVANLHALGAQVSFLSVVGKDMAGMLLRETLRERGVDDQWLLTDHTIHTPHKLRIVADGQHIARFDEGDVQTSHYTLETQQCLLVSLEELYGCSDAIVVSDYSYGVLSQEITERLQSLLYAHPKAILVDAQELARFRQFPATVVTPNYQEASLFVENINGRQHNSGGVPGPENLIHVEHMARQISSSFVAEYVAITLAEHGVFLLDRHGNATHLPAHPVAVAHDVGAGDSFASALTLALAAGGSMVEASQIGIDAAGIAVTKPRTAVVSYQELLQRVSVRIFTGLTQTLQGSNPQAALARLTAQLEVERLQGKIIVFSNGVFDILHVGHLQFLRQAKALGDILVVGVNSDASARRLKGPGRPINNELDRLALVAALDMVDHCLLFEGDTATDLLRALRPALYVKGGDYTNESLPEANVVDEIGGHIVILPLAGSTSTSRVIERIKRDLK
jgi:D-beta-D-heptose 7-phosphate kinase / D-beta-D-heptose 1-phosphate adenosyltransferase